MSGSARTTQRRAKVRPLLSDEEWAALEPHLAAWFASGSPTPPVASADAIRTIVYTMAGRAREHCSKHLVLIRNSRTGFTPSRPGALVEHEVLRTDSWVDHFYDRLPRIFAPYEVANRADPHREAAMIQRMRRAEDASRLRRQIENQIWFFVGDAMRSATGETVFEDTDSLEILEGTASFEDRGPRAIPETIDRATMAPSQPRIETIYIVATYLQLMVMRAKGNHDQCARDLEASFAQICPQSDRRPALLLAEEYRSGRIDRARCHMHYRGLPISASGARLGQLLDILDREMGLPSGLKPYSTLRCQPSLPVLEQPVMRTALAELGIAAGKDIASVFRKLRDGLEEFLAEDPELARLRAAGGSDDAADGISAAGSDA